MHSGGLILWFLFCSAKCPNRRKDKDKLHWLTCLKVPRAGREKNRFYYTYVLSNAVFYQYIGSFYLAAFSPEVMKLQPTSNDRKQSTHYAYNCTRTV